MLEQINPENIEEAELVHRLAQGDEEAFSCLFYTYKDKLYRFLLKVTQSDVLAKDILQDIFLKLWQNRKNIAHIRNLNAYLYRMAQNHALNEINRFARTTLPLSTLFNKDEDLQISTPIDALLSQEIREKLAEAVNQLPPQQQKVFILHKEQGIPHAEIACQMNLSVSTVENHMRQACRNLRHYLMHAYPGLFMTLSVGINYILKFF